MVVLSLDNHCGRDIGGYFDFRGKLEVLTVKVGRVDQQTEIRPATGLVGLVDGRIGACGKGGGGHDRKVGAGGEAHDANLVALDVELGGVGAHIAESSLGVL